MCPETKPATAAVVAVGEELLSGETTDTNGPWLGRRLASLGAPVVRRWVVGDDAEEIQAAYPAADKLLLLSTFIPFYIISHRGGDEWLIPFWGMLHMWVLIVILGRELLVTIFRQWAVRQDVVIAAGTSVKYKACSHRR